MSAQARKTLAPVGRGPVGAITQAVTAEVTLVSSRIPCLVGGGGRKR